jgi:hypothetical protein
MPPPRLPNPSSQEYLWWSQGARDEHDAQEEGLSPQVIQLIDYIRAVAQGYGKTATAFEVLRAAVRVYAPDLLRRKHRRQ